MKLSVLKVLAVGAVISTVQVLFIANGVPAVRNCQMSQEIEAGGRGFLPTVDGDVMGSSCKKLGLPQKMADIPLSPRAYVMDRGATSNFLILQIDKDIQPPVYFAMPNIELVTRRINAKGRMNVWESADIWNRSRESKPEDGIFIDVGGWIGDTSIPSAAMGIDTYVFEPVRNNTNMIHFAIAANGCHVSEHLTVVNALVGERNSDNESVYVTASRTDNAAATEDQAITNIGKSARDFEQPVQMITLDSFFPPNTKVQNLKIDTQGYELQVLRGALRLLKENREWVQVRIEHDEKLIKAAGYNPAEPVELLEKLGYAVVFKDELDMVFRAA